jgi:hypothetical protein
MAQISRPFQIALVVVVLLAGVWLFVLHGSSNTADTNTNASSSPVVTSSVAPSKAPVKHHSAPDKAHHAAVTKASAHSPRKGHATAVHAAAKSHTPAHTTRPAHRTAAAPAASHPSSAKTPATHKGAPASATATHAASASTTHKTSTPQHKSSAFVTPTGQKEVEAELKQGKIVVLLFWNPKGSDDVVVHNELQLLLKLHSAARSAKAKANEFRHAEKFFGLELDKQIAVHEAHANQVSSYGSITRSDQIYGTPTMLVINPKGQAITLTGIIDAYSIEQAIEEARAN